MSRKIICDVCGKEISTEARNELPWAGYMFHEVRTLTSTVKEHKYDLCYTCAERVKETIDQMIKDQKDELDEDRP